MPSREEVLKLLNQMRSGQANQITYNGVTGNPANMSSLYENAAESYNNKKDESDKTVDASAFDKQAKALYDFGQAVADFGGFQTRTSEALEEGDVPGVLGNFVGSLVPGVLSSPFLGASKIYGGLTGHNFQSIDENGQMDAQQLNGAQRAWELTDAAIDIGGLGVGGTGRVLGGVARSGVERSGSKGLQKAADIIMPEGGRGAIAGHFERAFRDSGDSAKRVAGFGGQVLSDIAVEGAEEFIQEIAEAGTQGRDFNQDLFNKALVAGGLGALGGGIMGAAGGGYHLAKDLSDPYRNAPKQAKADSDAIKEVGMYSDVRVADEDLIDRRAFVDPSVVKESIDTGKSNNVPGFRLTVQGVDSPVQLKADETAIGDEAVRSFWSQADNDNKEWFSNVVNIPIDELNEIFDLSKPGLSDADLMRLNSNLGQRTQNQQVAINRPPHLNHSSQMMVYLRAIVRGRGMQLHQMAALYGGGDIDADARGMFHNPYGKYATQFTTSQFMNPDGSSDLDFKFWPSQLDTDEARKRIAKKMTNIVEDNDIARDLVSYGTRAYSGGDSKYDNKSKEFAESLNRLYSGAYYKAIQNGSTNGQAHANASAIVSDAIDVFYQMNDNTAVIAAYCKDSIIEGKTLFDEPIQSGGNVYVPEVDTSRKGYTVRHTTGSTGGSRTNAGIEAYTSTHISLTQGHHGGGLFRSDSGFKYALQSSIDPRGVKFLTGVLNVERRDNAIDAALIALFKIRDCGETASENLSGVFRSFVAAEFYAWIEKNCGRIKIGEDGGLTLDDMYKKYGEIHDEYVREFNIAIEKVANDGWRQAYASFVKPEFGNISSGENKGLLIDEFRRTFEWLEFTKIFKVDDDSYIGQYGMTIGDITDSIYSRSSDIGFIEYDLSGDSLRFTKDMVNSKKSAGFNLESNVLASMNTIPTFKADDITVVNYVDVNTLYDAIVRFLGQKTLFNLGIYDAIDLAKSPWGKALAEGTGDIRVSQLISMELMSKTISFKQAVEKFRKTDDQADFEIAKREVLALRNGWNFWEIVAVEFVEKGSTATLDAMMDSRYEGYSYAFKSDILRRILEANGLENEPLFISIVQEGEGYDGYGQMSSKFNEALRNVKKACKSAASVCNGEITAFETYVNNHSTEDQKAMRDVWEQFVMMQKFDPNEEFYISMLMDSPYNIIKADEKGTDTAINQMAYDQTKIAEMGWNAPLDKELVDGAIQSYDYRDFRMNRLQFFDVWFNGKKVKVHNADWERVVDLEFFLGETPEIEIQEVDGTIRRVASMRQTIAFMRKVPIMARVFVPQTMVPVMNVENEGSVTQNAEVVAKNPIGEALEKFEEEKKKDLDDFYRRYEKKKMLHELMRACPDFYILVGGSVNTNEADEITHGEAEKAIRNMQDFLYNILCRDRNNVSGLSDEAEFELFNKMLYQFTLELEREKTKAETIQGNRTIISDPAEFIMSGQFFIKPILDEISKWTEGQLPSDLVSIMRKVSGVEDGDFRVVIETLFTNEFEKFLGKDDIYGDLNRVFISMFGKDRFISIFDYELKRFSNALKEYGIEVTPEITNEIRSQIESALDTYLNNPEYFSIDDIVAKDDANNFVVDLDKIRSMYEIILDDYRVEIEHLDKEKFGANEVKEKLDIDKIMEVIGNRDVNPKAAQKKHQEVLNLMANALVRSLRSQFGPSQLNPDIFMDMVKYSESFENVISHLQQSDLDFTHGDLNPREGIRNVPEIKASSLVNSEIATRFARFAIAGRIPTGVATNGAELMKLEGLAVVANYMKCNMPAPDPVKFGDIKDNLISYGDTACEILIPGEKRPRKIKSMCNMMRNYPDDADVFIYDIKEHHCTYPFCCDHFGGSYNPMSTRYIKTLDSFLSMLFVGQEDLMLKAKKVLNLTQDIVPNAGKDLADMNWDISVDGRGKSQQEIMNELFEILYGTDPDSNSQIERGFIDYLTGRFWYIAQGWGIHEDIGWNKLESIAIACSMYVEIKGVNGVTRVASLWELNDTDPKTDSFNKILKQLGGEIESIEIAPRSLMQINDRIKYKIYQATETGPIDANEAQQIAFKAVVDFSDYNTRAPENAEEFFGTFPVVNLAGPTHIIPSSHPTAHQIFFDNLAPRNKMRREFFSSFDSDIEPIEPSISFMRAQLRMSGIDTYAMDLTDDVVKSEYARLDAPITRFDVDTGIFNELDSAERMSNNDSSFWQDMRKDVGRYRSSTVVGKPSAAIIATNSREKIKNIINMKDEAKKFRGCRFLYILDNSAARSVFSSQNFPVIAIGTEDFLKIDTYNINIGDSGDTFKFAETEFSDEEFIDIYAVDSNFITSDADIKFDKRFAENYRYQDSEEITIECRNLIGFNPSIVAYSELQDAAKKILSDKSILLSSYSNEVVDNQVIPWLKKIADRGPSANTMNNGLIVNDIDINQPFGLISDINGNYMPLILTGNVPNTRVGIHEVSFNREGNVVVRVYYDVTFNDVGMDKFLAFLTGKGIGGVVDSAFLPETTERGRSAGGTMIASADTNLSRLLGQSPGLKKQALYLWTRNDNYGNAFIKMTDNGVEFNDALNLGDGSNGTITFEDLDRLMKYDHNDPIWASVASGAIKIWKPGTRYEYSNIQYARLAQEIRKNRNNLTITPIFTPYVPFYNGRIIKASEVGTVPANEIEWHKIRQKPINVQGAFVNFSWGELCAVFCLVNDRACPDPNPGAPEWVEGSTQFNKVGERLMIEPYADGPTYGFGLVMPRKDLNLNPGRGEVKAGMLFGAQDRIVESTFHGMRGDDWDFFKKRIMADYGNISGYQNDLERERKERSLLNMSARQRSEETLNKDFLDYNLSWNVKLENKNVNDCEQTFNRVWIEVVRGTGEDQEKISFHSSDFLDLRSAIGKKLSIPTERVSALVVQSLFCVYDGRTYDATGPFKQVQISKLWEMVNHIFSDSNGNIVLPAAFSDPGENRVCLGILPKKLALWIWNSTTDRSLYGTSFEDFVEKMFENFDGAKQIINSIHGNKKSTSDSFRSKIYTMKIMCDYLSGTYRRGNSSQAAMSRVDVNGYREVLEWVRAGFMPDVNEQDVQDIIDAAEEQLRAVCKNVEYLYNNGKISIEDTMGFGGEDVVKKNKKTSEYDRIFDNVNGLVQVMATADIGVAEGSFVEGIVRGGILDFITSLGFGPWNTNLRTIQDPNLIRTISEDEGAITFLKALREVNRHGDLDVFLIGIANGKDIEEVLNDIYGDPTMFERIKSKVFSLASADTSFVKAQLRRTLTFLDAYITAKDDKRWLYKPDGKRTAFEMALRSDPKAFLVEALSKDSTIRSELLRAINTSDTYSLAQNNFASIIIEHGLQKNSAARLGASLMWTPFIRYFTNIAGRGLNFFMPISTLNWYIVNHFSKFDEFKAMNIESVQVYTKMKYAMMADAAKMGSMALACILVALSAIEAPDDDDLKGNYREYLLCGRRIGLDYIFTDLLGPTIPYACFWYSVLHGEPRFDLLADGLGDIASRNPLMKIGDVIDIITAPDDFEDDLEDEASDYRYAFGGEPSPWKLGEAKAGALFLTMLGRVTTPSFIRSLGKGYDIERSYKRVWSTDVDNTDVTSGQTGDTVRISAGDALIRKVTRDNPVIGEVMNFIFRPETSFSGSTHIFADKEMPAVEIQDPVQRYVAKQYSINVLDEKTGEYVAKSEKDRQQVAMDVIATIQSYSDMDALVSTGFMIDSATRLYVGDVVWQMVTELQTEYYNWANSSEGNNYVLGGGDYQAGAEIKQQMYNSMQSLVQYWKNFYYKKLNSVQIKRGVQKYVRENVEYWQDDNGDWYASGIHRGMSLTSLDYLGVKSAPGTIDDAQGTMGYTGNWATPAKYNKDISTFERSLIPVNKSVDETIPFDDLANNHKAEATTLENAKNGKSSNSGGSNGGGSKYGRGSSGGGGGGGGNIYSRPSSTNSPTPRTISASKPGNSGRYDYLRPNFETKGSREASKRGDF